MTIAEVLNIEQEEVTAMAASFMSDLQGAGMPRHFPDYHAGVKNSVEFSQVWGCDSKRRAVKQIKNNFKLTWTGTRRGTIAQPFCNNHLELYFKRAVKR